MHYFSQLIEGAFMAEIKKGLIATLAILLCCIQVYAGTTGKIKGKVLA